MKRKSNSFMIVVILVIVMICLSFSAYAAATRDTVKYQISVIVSDSTSDRWTRFRAGLEQAAEDYDVNLNYVTTDKFAAQYEETKLMRDEAANGVDGIVVQLVSSKNASDLIEEISKKTFIGLVETDAEVTDSLSDSYFAVTADNHEIGVSLAEQVLHDHQDNCQSLKIAVLAGNQNQMSMQQRLAGLEETLTDAGCTINWVLENSSALEDVQSYESADVMISLDNDSLETAVSYVQTNPALIPQLYGIGCSDRTIYYLDKGTISSMIVPNEFNMGYESIMTIISQLKNRLSPQADVEVSYSEITKENLYSEENQKMLFPIVK
ncbi:MAG: substrate-binding domain-containing protein [Solobacterium sp.]|nr:substrate-binding domain-containing protein [Solobacterium sp.]MCH4222777.1 substrate-binding domain-containing protein [Solobacterium sp.]MCH4265986.1 substrate-binding domain-containing protein [Solobacterium sp.]